MNLGIKKWSLERVRPFFFVIFSREAKDLVVPAYEIRDKSDCVRYQDKWADKRTEDKDGHDIKKIRGRFNA
jgi:hypothetical protein